MSYTFYKVLHLLGILVVFCALSAAAMLALRQSTDKSEDRPVRKILGILHGVGLLVVLVAGFGLMARTGIVQGAAWPAWIYGKIGVWLLLGASVTFIRRAAGKALWWVIALPFIGAVAAYLAVVQPGAP